MDDLTGRVLPTSKQVPAAIIQDDPETIEIRARINSILEAVSATELFELRQTHAIEHKIVLTSDKIIKQRLRSVPHHQRWGTMNV